MDANTYIQAKNTYYQMDFCPGYWDWLDREFNLGNLASISMVYDELTSSNDELADWVKNRKQQFFDVMDEDTQKIFTDIAGFLSEQDFDPKNRDDFLGGADPWLIAKAKVINATVVTHEVFVQSNSRKVKVPNICQQFGIGYTNTFKLLNLLQAKFILEAST